MKRKFKRLVVISMIITILSMQLPTIILATEIIRSPRSIQEKIFKTDNSDNKNKLEYEEGKAIILYKNSSVSKKNKKSSILNEIKIDDTVSFEDVNQVSAYSSSSKDVDLKVSLVSSDKYSTEELVKKLNNQKEIIYAEPNYKVKATSLTNDEYLKYQWAIENIGQNGGIEGEHINTKETLSDKEKVIAIIDTGVDYTNSELKNHMWNNPHNKKKLAGQYGYDFVNNDSDPIDDAGHGTHCAGIMTATSDNKGITGAIINNNNVKIMALKFLDEEGSGSSYDAISAYNYIYRAQELGTNVVAVNNSWGGYASEEDIILKEIINLVGENGALSICASGNENTNTDQVINTPSGIDSDYIISVAATNEKGELATFSNYGKETVDIAAPGADILSTVSYNIFNPSVYSTEVKGNLCSKYENFESGLGSLNSNYKVTEGNVEVNTNNYFGTKGGKALEWSIKDAKEGKKYSLAIKIDETNATQVFSSMIKATSTGELVEDFMTGNSSALWSFSIYNQDYDSINLDETETFEEGFYGILGMDNYWNHITKELGCDKGTLVMQILPKSDGDITFTIDDFAISKDTVKEEFGKYEFYNGTSMATPYITAAVAIASNLYENEEALTLKNRILCSSKEIKSLSDKVATSGVLDIEKFSEPKPIITSAVMDKNGNVTVIGDFFGDNPKLYVNDKEVNAKYNKDERVLVFNDPTLKNKNLEFKINTGKYEYSKKVYLAIGEEFDSTSYELNQFLPAVSMTSDGNDIYVLQKDLVMNVISEYGIQNVIIDGYTLFDNYGKIEENTTEIKNDTGLVYNDGEIYTVFSLDYGYTINKVLAQYDKEGCSWIKITDIPSEYNTLCPTIASYNGEIYLIGGYDMESKKITTSVYKYDMDQDKWTKTVEIPEGRVASKASQVGNKLVVLMGANEAGTMPEPLIFNGSTWKKSETKLEVVNKKYKLTDIPSNNIDEYEDESKPNKEDKDIPEVYSAGIGVVSNGVIITGLKTDGFGDTFIYNVEKDSYEESGYVLSETGYTTATVVENTLYAMSISLYDNVSGYGMKLTEVEGLSLIPFELVIDGAGIEIPDGRGDLLVQGKYEYNQGTTINIKPEIVDYKYYIKSITVNGRAVSGTSYKLVLSEPTKIVVKTQKYPSISGLKMNSQTTSSVKVSWNKLKEAEGYQVYLYNSKTKKYQKYKYTNSNSLTFSKLNSSLTYKIKVDGIKKINGSNRIISTANTTIGTKTVTPNISSIISSKKSATVKWKKISGASGYEIYMSTSKNGKYTRKKTVTNGKTISSKITGLKSKKNYYFKIRTYKTISGKKIYSSFSKVKLVKVK